MSKFFKVGLALGGGGARGSAHLGVLSVLEREKISFDLIVGTSFGALVGCKYAMNPDAAVVMREMVEFVGSSKFKQTTINYLKENLEAEKQERGIFYSLKSYVKRGIFLSMSIRKGAFISEDDFLNVIRCLIGDSTFEDAKIPFSCVTTDLISGREILLDNGSMLEAVSASCSIPGVFPPITLNGGRMVDGGWVNKVPAEPAIAQGADFVIGVDTSDNFMEMDKFNTGLQIITRANDITRNVLSEFQSCYADFVIRPNVGHIHWTRFDKISDCYKIGVEATEAVIPQLKASIMKKKLTSLVSIKRGLYKAARDKFLFMRR